MAPSGKLRRSENLPDEGLVWAGNNELQEGQIPEVRRKREPVEVPLRKRTFCQACIAMIDVLGADGGQTAALNRTARGQKMV